MIMMHDYDALERRDIAPYIYLSTHQWHPLQQQRVLLIVRYVVYHYNQ